MSSPRRMFTYSASFHHTSSRSISTSLWRASSNGSSSAKSTPIRAANMRGGTSSAWHMRHRNVSSTVGFFPVLFRSVTRHRPGLAFRLLVVCIPCCAARGTAKRAVRYTACLTGHGSFPDRQHASARRCSNAPCRAVRGAQAASRPVGRSWTRTTSKPAVRGQAAPTV